MKLFINSQYYPYGNLNLNVYRNQYAILYTYANFQNSYYGKDAEPDYDKIGSILQDGLWDAKTVFVTSEARKVWLERFHFIVSDITECGYQDFDYPKQVTACAKLPTIMGYARLCVHCITSN